MNSRPRPVYAPRPDAPIPPPKDRPNPIALAVACLGVTEKNGTYWIGNRPVSTIQMMQAYNRQRVQIGLEQLVFNEQWRVPT